MITVTDPKALHPYAGLPKSRSAKTFLELDTKC